MDEGYVWKMRKRVARLEEDGNVLMLIWWKRGKEKFNCRSHRPKTGSSRGERAIRLATPSPANQQGMRSSLAPAHWLACISFHFVSCSNVAIPFWGLALPSKL